MDHLPAIELLESTHSFPCEYTFKVIGTTESNFMGRALQTVRRMLPEEMEPPFSSRTTPNGRHVSVTIEPTLETAADVLAIYRELAALEGLVMLM